MVIIPYLIKNKKNTYSFPEYNYSNYVFLKLISRKNEINYVANQFY